MTIYDLVLILVVLAVIASVVGAAIQALQGHLYRARLTLGASAIGVAIYIAIICMVSLASKETVQALGTQDCNDDWCMTPVSVRRKMGVMSVEFKVWSRARRVSQREFGVKPYLLDETGRHFESYEAAGPPFDRRLEPNESFNTVRRFHVDGDAKRIDLVLRDGFGPATFVIGASQSLLHKRTVYRLKPGL